MGKIKILFVCTANKDRSATAEALYRGRSYLEVKSAGTWKYAPTTLTVELLEWADHIIVMERVHEKYIREQFPTVAEKKIHCLHIRDKYRYRKGGLVQVIEARMGRLNWSK